MPTYGTEKYHNYFGIEYQKFMCLNGYKLGRLNGREVLVKMYDNNISDVFDAYPTVAGPWKDGFYSMKIIGSFRRNHNLIEDLGRTLLCEFKDVNNSFMTISALAGTTEFVELSENGANQLLGRWKELIYSNVILDLQQLNAIENLDILFHDPVRSKALGYDKLVFCEKTGIRGEVRSALVAKFASNPRLGEICQSYIERYEAGLKSGYRFPDKLTMRIEVLEKIRDDLMLN